MAQAPVMQTVSLDEVIQAREEVAQRLERLARRVRSNTTTTVEELDQAYAAIVKLAAELRPFLLNR